MARVRMMLGLCVLAGCSAAAAEPSVGSAAPPVPLPGWEAVPAIASAVAAAAKADGIVVDSTQAWGETAMGCYAVRIALHGAGNAKTIAEDALASLSADRTLAIRDVVSPGPELALTFERGRYRGRLRAQLTDRAISATACFANERERAACERACTTLLGPS